MAKLAPPRQADIRIGTGGGPVLAPPDAGADLSRSMQDMAGAIESINTAIDATVDSVERREKIQTRSEIQNFNLTHREWLREDQKVLDADTDFLNRGTNRDKRSTKFFQGLRQIAKTKWGRQWVDDAERLDKVTWGRKADMDGRALEQRKQEKQRELLETQAIEDAAQAVFNGPETSPGGDEAVSIANEEAVDAVWEIFEKNAVAEIEAGRMWPENLEIHKKRFEQGWPIRLKELYEERLGQQASPDNARDLKHSRDIINADPHVDDEGKRAITNVAEHRWSTVDANEKIRKVEANTAVNEDIAQTLSPENKTGNKYGVAYDKVTQAVKKGTLSHEEANSHYARIAASAKAVSEGKDDPYKVTQNPELLNKFWRQATSDPESLDPKDVWAAAGKADGISTPDAVRIITELEDEASALKTPQAKMFLERYQTLVDKDEMSPVDAMTKLNELRQFLVANPKATPQQMEDFWQTQIEPVVKGFFEKLFGAIPSVPPMSPKSAASGMFGMFPTSQPKTQVEPNTQAEFEDAVRNMTDQKEAQKYYDKWKDKW